MRPAFVRSVVPRAAAMLLLFAAACGPSDLVGESKLEPIKKDMTLTEIAAIIGTGPLVPNQPDDSLRLFHGYRTQIFLAGGNQYQVVWYREAAGKIEDAITRETETPIVLKDEKVIGTGWNFYDETATEQNLPNPYRSDKRLDSIAKSQIPK